MDQKPKHFEDQFVIYHSSEDGCWIAHSLRTDQIGMGNDVVTALTDAIKAVDSVCRLAAHDSTLAYLREAPLEIQEMAKRSKRLLREFYEVAHRKARGNWPDDQPEIIAPALENESYIIEAEEAVS